MPSNTEEQPNTTNHLFDLPTTNNRNEQDLEVTGTGESASEVTSRLNPSSDSAIRDQINSEECKQIHKICSENNIQSTMADYMLKLREFEIVIVCDDSGSMNTEIGNTGKTRWDELCSIIKVIIGICVVFDSNGVDIHFLNRGEFHKVKDVKHVDEAFKNPPCGYTLLVPVLKKIFESRLARRGADKKLLVFVATDGEPTDEDSNPTVPELEQLMNVTRQKETTFVSFLLCTDERASVDYLKEWDRKMLNVDVTDDFDTEVQTIRRCQEDDNYPFTRGDYIVKALVGAIIPVVDRLNEPKK